MGMKQRKCDVCGKKRRYDFKSYLDDGWVVLEDGLKKCPYCHKKDDPEIYTECVKVKRKKRQASSYPSLLKGDSQI